MDHVNIDNSGRGGDVSYRKVIEKIATDKVCPFCIENLTKYHKNPILKDAKYWIVTTNMYPYKNTLHHFLLIHKKHTTSSKDISAEAWTELHGHIDWLTETYKVPGGTFFMRCGDTNHTGASVTHLHAQMVVTDTTKVEPVLARFG